MISAAICTIGDEILIGQIVDTNSSAIARSLNKIGVKSARMVSISDDKDDIKQSLNSLLQRFDIIIVTGGLGPTKDDITKHCLYELSNSSAYIMHEAQLEVVKRILSTRGIELSDINRNQALVPSAAEVIVNNLGTAPCMVFRFGEEQYSHSPILYSLPGVPFEAIALLDSVNQDIKNHKNLNNIYHKTITTFGIAESTLAKMIESWEDSLPTDMKLAYLPNAINGVRLRLSSYGSDNKELQIKRIEQEFEKLYPVLGDAIYGEGEDTLATVIANILTQNGKTLSVAESCTGGRVASEITAIPGASAFFNGSVTSYSNTIKEKILGVDPQIIIEHGAVSKECAEAMAVGVLERLETDFSVATTGIAGPGGGTPEKPVGTVWIATAYRDKKTSEIQTSSQMLKFSSNRATNIDRFCGNALNMLRKMLFEQLHS